MNKRSIEEYERQYGIDTVEDFAVCVQLIPKVVDAIPQEWLDRGGASVESFLVTIRKNAAAILGREISELALLSAYVGATMHGVVRVNNGGVLPGLTEEIVTTAPGSPILN